MHKTIVEPTAFLKTPPPNVDVDASSPEDQNKDLNSVKHVQALQEQIEEMYLGHISESHYVSLRPNNWRENLFEGEISFIILIFL